MPGTLRSRSSFSRHTGLWRRVCRRALVQIVQLLLQPGYVALDAGLYSDVSTGEAVPFRYQHGHHLLSAGHQRVEGLGLGVPEGTLGRTNGLGEVSQDRRIQRIGLGQPPSGLGKVPHLARVDYHHRQGGSCQGCHQGQFQSARSLQHQGHRTELLHVGHQRPDPSLVVGDFTPVSPRTDGNIHPGLGHINPYVDTVLLHENLPVNCRPVLARYGLGGPRQLFGLGSEKGAATQA